MFLYKLSISNKTIYKVKSSGNEQLFQ